MFRFAVLLAAVVWVQPARADFVLTGNEHLNVTSFHDMGVLLDSSTAYVKEGGGIGTLNANNDSGVVVSGGGTNELNAYDTSDVEIHSGIISYVRHLNAYDSSSVKMTGGSVGRLNAYNDSSVDISGGSISYLNVHNNSSVDISAGNIGGLNVYDTSNVTLYGYDFRDGGGLDLDGGRILGTGMLMGKWFDDTPWFLTIISNHPSATIMAIPEPSTLALLILAAVMAAGVGLYRLVT